LEEKEKVLKSENGEINLTGLKILGCGKTYNITNGFCRNKKLNALKEVFFIKYDKYLNFI
jgi:hypothetical protein